MFIAYRDFSRPTQLALTAALVVFAGCGGVSDGVTTPVATQPVGANTPTRVDLPVTPIAIAGIGVTQTINATIRDGLGKPIPAANISWSSDDPAVAEVTANGNVAYVVARAAGETQVRATSGTAMSAVHVRVLGVRALAVTPKTAAVRVRDSLRLSVSVQGDPGVSTAVQWSVVNPAVASVSATGVVTGLSVGTTNVLVRSVASPAVTATVTMTITAARSVSLAPELAALTMWAGDTRTIPAQVDVDSLQSRAVTWSSGNASVASVTTTGAITAVRAGSAILTVTATADPRAKAQMLLTVLPARSVTVAPATMSVGVQRQATLRATVVIENTLPTTVRWSTSDAAIATVSSAGVVTGVALGRATITATSTADSTRRASAIVTVAASVRAITVTPTTVATFTGSQDQLVANVTADAPLARTVTWRSSNTAIATVSATGLVSSIAAGQATITATSTADTSVRATSAFTIQVAPTVVVSPAQASMHVGESRTLSGRVNGNTNTPSTWRSSNTAVATVGPTGIVVGQSVGTATISMFVTADSTRRASATVTVTPSVRSITVSPPTATGLVGQSVQLTATVVADGGLALTSSWRSSDATVASVSASGLVSMRKAGQVTITALATADTTKRATAAVSVGAPQVHSVSLSPAVAALAIGQTQQLGVSVAADAGLSQAVTFRTTSANVASVSANGVVTAIAAGSTSITAVSVADTTKRATATITVSAPSVRSVSLTPSAASLNVGQTQQLAAFALVDAPLSSNVILRSSHSAVATVSPAGLVTAVGNGSATITAIAAADTTKRATATITVTSIPVAVSITTRPVNVTVGQTRQLFVTVSAGPGASTAVTWSAAAASVASVSTNGLVSAVSAGSTLITATSVADPTKRDTVTVVTTAAVTQLATSWSASRMSGALYEDVVSTVGFGASASFAVNIVGDVFRWDGNSWTVSTRGSTFGGQFVAVHGSSSSNVVAVGTNGLVARFDGNTWTQMTSGTTASLADVWVDGVGSAYAVGTGGTVRRLVGSAWSAMASGSTQSLNGVWVSGSTVFAVGNSGEVLRYDGVSWTRTTPTTATLYSVSGSAVDHVVAVGANGVVVRYNGTSWSTVANSVTAADLYAVDGTTANGNRMYIASGAGLLQLDGTTLTLVSTPYTLRLFSVSADGAGTVWTGGQRGAVMLLSGAWTTSNLSPDLLDVWTTSSTNAWAVGEFGFVHRWNGSSWSRQATPTAASLYAVWGASASDAFAGGDNGTMLRFNGSSWTAMSFPSSATINALWGSSSSDVYAVTSAGEVLRYNGSSWSMVTTNANPLWGVYGVSAADVYVTGENGTVLRYNGSSWSSQSAGLSGTMVGLWGSATSNLIAVGVSASGSVGAAFRFNTSWTPLSVGTPRVLTSIWGPNGTDVYATGDQGTMLRYNGTSWQLMSTGTSDLLWSVSGSPTGTGGAFAVGYNSTVVTGAGVGGRVVASMRGVSVSLDPSPSARGRTVTMVPDGSARAQRKGMGRAVAAGRATVPPSATAALRARGER